MTSDRQGAARKPALTAAQLRDEINKRFLAAGLDDCRATLPTKAPLSKAFGRNWRADIEGARSGAVYDEATRIVREVGAAFDCSDFPSLKRQRPQGPRR